MQAELEQKSIELLGWLEQTIKTTTNFGAEQIPLFIQELLRYNYWMSLTWFILGVLILITSIYTVYKFIKFLLKTDNMEFSPSAMFWVLPIVVSIHMISVNTEWIMIQLAPRVYLLEYIKEMIKH